MEKSSDIDSVGELQLADIASFFISFGDPAEMLEAITPSRIELMRVVREQPDSITGLARRVNRDRSAVARDIKALVSLGLVQTDEEVNPGHGRHKLVKPVGAG